MVLLIYKFKITCTAEENCFQELACVPMLNNLLSFVDRNRLSSTQMHIFNVYFYVGKASSSLYANVSAAGHYFKRV